MPGTTETQLKLSDAATQMILALRQPEHEPTVRSCINSFLSAARSVTFVMQKESAASAELAEWYQHESEKLGQNPLMKFFNDRRVYSIHRGVVVPAKSAYPMHGFEQTPAEGGAKPQFKMSVLRADSPTQPAAPGDILFLQDGVVFAWRFDGVDGYLPGHSGNVFRLCEDYFVLLKALVKRWLAKRDELGLV